MGSSPPCSAPELLALDEEQHRPLAEYCRVMLDRLQDYYEARAQAR